jgi:alpha-L-fucosidase 2
LTGIETASRGGAGASRFRSRRLCGDVLAMFAPRARCFRRSCLHRFALAALTAAAGLAAPAPAQAAVDWPRFLARHDLVWQKVPQSWQEGAFLGNGLLGAMIYAEGNALHWELGRTDVTDPRTDARANRANPRLPIGRLLLETAGEITGGAARLDLWNAEVSGTLTTTRGKIAYRSFVHAQEPVLVVELEPTGAERDAAFAFRPALAMVERLIMRKEAIGPEHLNPAPFVQEQGALRLSVQPLAGGGEHVVAWQPAARGRLLVVSITRSAQPEVARREAAAAVARALAQGPERLRRSHRDFWHAYYPQSFLSLPDPRLESFYWIQMYKLAAATRADRPAIDTLGPWYHRTPWPRIWWNLNIQLTYWPVYTANRLALGESMLALIDRNKETFRKNVPEALREDAYAVGRSSGPDGHSPVGGPGSGPGEMSDLVWALHNYWLHYRHTMDQAMLRERLYPLLRGSVNYLLRRLEPGKDGKLHLPEAISPEYPKTAPDTNYDLSLLRWGCETLIAIERRLGTGDPLAAKWRDTLARLTPYPVGPTGYLIGRDQPLAVSHRHFSHLLMVYPLELVTPDKPEDRALIERSLAHWIGFEGALQGYSFVGASAISSLLGKGDDAARFLDQLIGRFVKPNTMYLEAGPVIETPLAAAQAVHEMLLQNHRDVIRVFPAVPSTWKDVVFQDLRTEGAFLVTAARRGGSTKVVRLTSLAGEPATLEVVMKDATVQGSGTRPPIVKSGENRWRLLLAKGESATLVAADATAADQAIAPVAADPGRANPFGVR